MTAWRLVAAFIARRPLTWAFHALTLALGVAVLTAVLALDAGLSNRFQRDLAGVDLVVGAKGSPLQLILSAVFQLDAPTGNIALGAADAIAANRLVRRAVPVSMGDSVQGARIVGTTPGYVSLYGARLAAGRMWARPLEAVLGAEVARRTGLGVGASFAGEHGLAPGGEAHAGAPYRVVGVLAPSGAVIDRLVLTDTASVWAVHAHPGEAGPREVTALLITYRSAMGALMLPRFVAAQPNLQAASPAVEVGRLTSLLGAGAEVLRSFGLGLLALSALGFFTALFAAVSQRRRELALLEALGAGPWRLFALVAVEALALGLAGGLGGLVLGRVAAAFAAMQAARGGGPSLALPPVGLTELLILGGALLLSLAAAAAPGLIAARTRAAAVLREG